MSPELLKAVARLTGPSPVGAVNSSGIYDNLIVAIAVDENIVKSALPLGTSLLPDGQTPQGSHPVILTLGEQSNVRASNHPEVYDYHEAIIGIPNVTVDGRGEGPVIYLPRLDLDNLTAVLVGLFLGLPKHLKSITTSASQFTVSTLITKSLLESAYWEPTSDVKTPADFPYFNHVGALIQQPLLGVDAVGGFIYTDFQWHLDQATLQGVRAQVNVPHRLPGLPAYNYTIPGFESQAFGAGRLRVPWNLSGPFFHRP
jgi:hypothetical protein